MQRAWTLSPRCVRMIVTVVGELWVHLLLDFVGAYLGVRSLRVCSAGDLRCLRLLGLLLIPKYCSSASPL